MVKKNENKLTTSSSVYLQTIGRLWTMILFITLKENEDKSQKKNKHKTKIEKINSYKNLPLRRRFVCDGMTMYMEL